MYRINSASSTEDTISKQLLIHSGEINTSVILLNPIFLIICFYLFISRFNRKILQRKESRAPQEGVWDCCKECVELKARHHSDPESRVEGIFCLFASRLRVFYSCVNHGSLNRTEIEWTLHFQPKQRRLLQSWIINVFAPDSICGMYCVETSPALLSFLGLISAAGLILHKEQQHKLILNSD